MECGIVLISGAGDDNDRGGWWDITRTSVMGTTGR